ncbi:hypothetical protein [uncultured Oscillibacter sp.]|uniref:hypothetical protein n=1 Tax=uncultured Oscillibacter sp. TaxID=876091 RepID=UPI0026375971|nr:hypothetical protein [uncultured Oscillibacter sp.]
MGTFGFSYVGAIFLLCLLVPNLLWTRCRPRDYDPSVESRSLLALERTGQVWTTCAALVFQDFNLRPWTPWSWWLIGAVALMVLYELWWLRYFRSARTMADFTSSLLGVPVAGASLPVAAFFLLGIYGRVVWMLLGVTVLGMGHIGIHLRHRREIRKETDI